MKWEYGGSYKTYPIDEGQKAEFDNGTTIMVHDIFNPLPEHMKQADCLFIDPPWNIGNIRSFYTKADKILDIDEFQVFYTRLFECVKEINPRVCYIEVGKQYLPDFIIQMRKQFKYVTFYNSSYYHRKDNMCYVIRGSNKARAPKLDYMDEEDIIDWVCREEQYGCIGDLCMGRGLVALYAYKYGRKAVGTELNKKRVSVMLEEMVKLGAQYRLE